MFAKFFLVKNNETWDILKVNILSINCIQETEGKWNRDNRKWSIHPSPQFKIIVSTSIVVFLIKQRLTDWMYLVVPLTSCVKESRRQSDASIEGLSSGHIHPSLNVAHHPTLAIHIHTTFDRVGYSWFLNISILWTC